MAQTVRAHDGLPRWAERLLLGVIVAALVIGLGGLVIGLVWFGSTAREGVENHGAAWACRDFVTNRLRAPATASWPWLDEEKVTRAADGAFTVRSYVDAQNAYGANIRTRYTCVVRPPTSDGQSWSLVSLEL